MKCFQDTGRAVSSIIQAKQSLTAMNWCLSESVEQRPSALNLPFYQAFG